MTEIARDLAGAAHAHALAEAVLLGIGDLALVGRRQVRGGGANAQFGKVALFHLDLALAAGLMAAADRFDLDTHAACRLQQRRAGGHVALAAIGLKDDARALAVQRVRVVDLGLWLGA